MNSADEIQFISSRCDAALEPWRLRMHAIVQQATADWIDHCRSHGYIPLGPLNGLREPWYLGDLR